MPNLHNLPTHLTENLISSSLYFAERNEMERNKTQCSIALVMIVVYVIIYLFRPILFYFF